MKQALDYIVEMICWLIGLEMSDKCFVENSKSKLNSNVFSRCCLGI